MNSKRQRANVLPVPGKTILVKPPDASSSVITANVDISNSQNITSTTTSALGNLAGHATGNAGALPANASAVPAGDGSVSHESPANVQNDDHMQHSDFATYSSRLAEYQHFMRTINAYKSYSTFANRRISLAFQQFNKLSARHRNLIPSDFSQHLADLREAVYHNQQLVDQMIAQADNIFGEHAPWADVVAAERLRPNNHIPENSDHPTAIHQNDDRNQANLTSAADIRDPRREQPPTQPASYHFEKVQTTLRQLARDWSSSGAEERKKCYSPITDAVEEYLPIQRYSNSSSPPRILVPGAGLCRLAWEFARRGYAACANEFSMYMLVGSYFVLNCCTEIDQYSLQPWATSFSNNKTRRDQLAQISFPDVYPHELPGTAQFCMSAGDFTRVFANDAGNFDAVATCFFIDTAHNVLEYLETIWEVLKPGGYWVNLGPLLYHFDDVQDEQSLELPYEDLKKAILKMGFQYVKEEFDHKCPYIEKSQSMMCTEYRCVFFVCRKSLS